MASPVARLSKDKLWTEDEFLALPETNERMELVDGELIREPSATFGHQSRIGLLHHRLVEWSATRSPRPDVCLSALDLRVGPGRILQPDVFVYVTPLERPVTMPLRTIPDLCIEVTSRDRLYDRVTKRELYADAGVPEYWTVVAELGFVERWTGPRLTDREEHRDRMSTALLPGFTLDVAELLREP
jgi:Uma2 family endonuclease